MFVGNQTYNATLAVAGNGTLSIAFDSDVSVEQLRPGWARMHPTTPEATLTLVDDGAT